MGYQVGLTEEAQADLGAVVRFLARQSPEAAQRIGHELLDAALTLTSSPGEAHRCGGVRDCASSPTAII